MKTKNRSRVGIAKKNHRETSYGCTDELFDKLLRSILSLPALERTRISYEINPEKISRILYYHTERYVRRNRNSQIQTGFFFPLSPKKESLGREEKHAKRISNANEPTTFAILRPAKCSAISRFINAGTNFSPDPKTFANNEPATWQTANKLHGISFSPYLPIDHVNSPALSQRECLSKGRSDGVVVESRYTDG